MVLCLYACSYSKHQDTCLAVLLICSNTSDMVLPNVSWLFFAFYNILVNFHAYNVRIGHFKHGLQQQLLLQEKKKGEKIFLNALFYIFTELDSFLERTLNTHSFRKSFIVSIQDPELSEALTEICHD